MAIRDNMKFRVWDNRDNVKLFHPPSDYRVDGDGVLYHSVLGLLGYPDFLTLESCTGFKDQNSTLIYEGDIIESRCRNIHFKEEYTRRVVIFSPVHGRFYASHTKSDIRTPLSEEFCATCRIVGNIHENPLP